MSKKKLVMFVIVLTLIISVLLLKWFDRAIPNSVSKFVAVIYVEKNYDNMDLMYIFSEYSPYHDQYLIYFKDQSDKRYTFVVDSFTVVKDPFKLP